MTWNSTGVTMRHLLLTFLFASLWYQAVDCSSCVCEDKTLCQPLTSPLPEREIFAFAANDEAFWRQYDWTRVTTICKFGEIDPQMVCYAHSKGVRVTYGVWPDIHNCTSPQFRKQFVQQQTQYIRDNHLDGVNVDMEPVIRKDQVKLRDGMAALMDELYVAVKTVNPQMQVTFDAPAYPGPPTEGIFPHYYDFLQMSKAVDFYFIMFYAMTGPNVSWANSPLNSTEWAINLFIKEGIPVTKLLLGVPWYGYRYPCSQLQGNKCEVDVRNPGDSYGYRIVMEEYFPLSTSGRLYDPTAESPFFNYKNVTNGQLYQVWYDDPTSLKLRSDYAIKMNLRGVGMWTANDLDYSNSTQGKKMVADMWNSLPKYHHERPEQIQDIWVKVWGFVQILLSYFTT